MIHIKTVLQINGKTILKVIKLEAVYQRALSVSANGPDFDLRKVLSRPLTSISSAIF